MTKSKVKEDLKLIDYLEKGFYDFTLLTLIFSSNLNST